MHASAVDGGYTVYANTMQAQEQRLLADQKAQQQRLLEEQKAQMDQVQKDQQAELSRQAQENADRLRQAQRKLDDQHAKLLVLQRQQDEKEVELQTKQAELAEIKQVVLPVCNAFMCLVFDMMLPLPCCALLSLA